MRKHLASLVLTLLSTSTYAVEVREGMAFYLNLDQNYNLPSRQNDEIVLSDQDKTPRDLQWRLVNMADVHITGLDEASIKFFDFDSNSQRLYIPIPPAITQSGRVEGRISRVLSRSTNIYNGAHGFQFLKFSKFTDPYANTTGQVGPVITKYWHALKYHVGEPDRRWRIMEEPTSVFLSSGRASYAVTLRPIDEFERAFSEGYHIVPLHGLFGCKECLTKVARAAGFNVADWITKIYLPRLAQSVAEQNLRYGLYLAGHTQNTNAAINLETGELGRFVLRDLADVLLDPSVMLAAVPDFDFSGFKPLRIGLTHTDFVADNKIDARDPGVNFSFYTIQSIDRIDVNVPSLDLLKTFLQYYRSEADRILGGTFQLSAGGRTSVGRIHGRKIL